MPNSGSVAPNASSRRLCLLVEGLEKLAHGLSALGISGRTRHEQA